MTRERGRSSSSPLGAFKIFSFLLAFGSLTTMNLSEVSFLSCLDATELREAEPTGLPAHAGNFLLVPQLSPAPFSSSAPLGPPIARASNPRTLHPRVLWPCPFLVSVFVPSALHLCQPSLRCAASYVNPISPNSLRYCIFQSQNFHLLLQRISPLSSLTSHGHSLEHAYTRLTTARSHHLGVRVTFSASLFLLTPLSCTLHTVNDVL